MKARIGLELSERDTILRQLRRTGKWTSRRSGARIRMWKRQEPGGMKVGYQIFPRRGLTVTGYSLTISGAISACNEVLRPVGRPASWSQAPTPSVPVPGASLPQEWLPYKDA